MLRTVGWVFVSLLLGYFGGCMSVLGAPELGLEPEVPREVALDALAREVANAKALGFEEVRRGTHDGSGFTYFESWKVEADHCFAFVLVTWGPRGVTPISLLDEADASRELARGAPAQNVTSAQVCVSAPVTLTPRGSVGDGRRGLYLDPVHAEWVMLTAPKEKIGGNEKLNRGQVPLEVAAEPAADDVPTDDELDKLLKSLEADADAGR